MSQQINLFNPIFLQQQKVFSLLTMLQAFGLIGLGTLLFYGYALYQVDQLTKQSQESDLRFKAEQEKLIRATAEFSPQQANKLLQDEIQDLDKKNQQQAEVVDALKSGAVGNTTGYSGYMQAFSRQVVNGLWLTGFKIVGDGAQISLNGAVLKPELLPAYIQRLNHEDVMNGKTFSALQMTQPAVDKEAGRTNALIAEKVAVVERDWVVRQQKGTRILPEEWANYQKALAIAKTPPPPPVSYVEFALQSELGIRVDKHIRVTELSPSGVRLLETKSGEVTLAAPKPKD